MPGSQSSAPSIKHEKSYLEQKVVELPLSPEQEQSQSVSFFQLFRYSTRFEIFLDSIGILAALVAGAAQANSGFVTFNQILTQARNGVPGAEDSIPAAAEKFRHDAASNAAAVVYIGVGLFACTYAYMNIWIYTGEVNAKRIREQYLQAVLRQDIAFFDSVGPGEITARIQTDTHLVQQGISEKVPLVAFFLGAFSCAFIIAYVRSWRLALALTSMVPCMAIAGAVMNSLGVKYKQASLRHIANGSSIAEEVVSTIRVAQAFGTQTILASIYGTQIYKAKLEALKGTISQASVIGIYHFVMYSCYALAFSFGTTLINSNRANAGEVINVFMSIFFGAICLGLLPPELQAINNGRSAAAKLYETIDRIPAIDSANTGGLKPDDVVGEIVFDNVRFSYPSRPAIEVTKGISITFQAGKTSALVGASGSGKSTLVSLIERFYDPRSGSVKFDERDVRELNIKWLRSQIGLVSQEPTLFSTTIKQNVAYGLIGTKHEHASDEEKDVLVRRACVKANADGFINQLPQGYDTLVGERGVLLSGGQRQRVAIARAIVSEPRVLLLDEATSALDTQSEEVVQDALDKAAAGRTTITIAHRLSTIKDADVIYVMGNGVVLESGTHFELLQRPQGAYTKLVEAQKLRDEDDIAHSHKEMRSDTANRREPPLERKYTNDSSADDMTYASPGMAQPDEGDYSILYIMKRMAIIGRSQMHHYVFGVTIACINSMVYPAFAIVFGKGIVGFSLGTNAERRHAGDRTALWLFLMAIISCMGNGNSDRLFNAASVRLTALLRDLSFKSVLRQDVSFFDKTENTTGHLVSQMTDNPQKVEALTGMTLNASIQSFASVIVGSVVGLIFVWKVGLVGIACTPFILIGGFIHMRVITEKDQKNKKAHAHSAHLACEASQSIRTVAALTMEDDCLRLYAESLDGPLRRSVRAAVVSGVLFGVSQGISFFAIALIFWYGSLLVSRQEVSLFHFFVGLMSTSFTAVQASNILQFIPDISSAKSASSDIIRLLDSIPAIDAGSQSGKVVDAEKIQGHIRFEDVHFRYPTRTEAPVLRGLSLEAQPGTYIALVGASGSGKSTAIQLIERFYDPLHGNIYLDGQKIDELNIQEYRKSLALVSQEPTLYSGTIKFNILLGAIKPHAEVTQDEIENVCRDANILDFIQGLPEGFDTEVGGKGSQLSGGQKQRIAIARALLRDPKILLLDEATSALDSASEKVVQAALDHAAKGRTTIAIAHRLSTIQNADRIYFLKDGRVSEQGTHDELLAQKGDYFEFVMLQGLSKS